MKSLCRHCRIILFLVAAVALLAASGLAADARSKGLPKCDPASVGMDAQVLSQIRERMLEFIHDNQISGAVTLVARRGCVAHLEAVGLAGIAEKTPMTVDTLFAIASMTKPVTATALMILQDEKKLAVDDPVSKYIPAFKDIRLAEGRPAREITIRDLVTHTSGIVGDQRTERTLQETVDAILRRPLGFEPGSKWQYSPGLNVCGRIIEIVSGKPYDRFVAERILRPLGMVDSTFHPTPEQKKRLAVLYGPEPDKRALVPSSHWLREDVGQRAPNPSGGLWSTAPDMARFYQMVLNHGQLDGRRIVSEAAVGQMTHVQTGDLVTGFTPGNGWGLGWCVVRKPEGVTAMLSPGAFGHGGAFGTQGWVDPKRQMIFVLMIQRTGLPNSDASDIRRAFQETAVKAARG